MIAPPPGRTARKISAIAASSSSMGSSTFTAQPTTNARTRRWGGQARARTAGSRSWPALDGSSGIATRRRRSASRTQGSASLQTTRPVVRRRLDADGDETAQQCLDLRRLEEPIEHVLERKRLGTRCVGPARDRHRGAAAVGVQAREVVAVAEELALLEERDLVT